MVRTRSRGDETSVHSSVIVYPTIVCRIRAPSVRRAVYVAKYVAAYVSAYVVAYSETYSGMWGRISVNSYSGDSAISVSIARWYSGFVHRPTVISNLQNQADMNMSQALGVFHYAVKWPITQGQNVYNTGRNAIPIPFISHILGLLVGAVTATFLLFFVGWVLGVGKFALSMLGR